MLEEPMPSYAALLRWAKRYPQYGDALADFFATWTVQAVMPQTATVDEEKLVEKGVRYAVEIARRQSRIVSRPRLSHLRRSINWC